MMKPEEQMRQLGEQEAMTTEKLYSEASPSGKFSKRALAPFVAAINKLVAMLDKSVPPLPLPKEDIKGKMPVEVATRLAAISSAIKDYDKEGDYEMPEAIASDDDLVAVVMVFDKASKDKGFKKFLSAPVPEAPSEMSSGEGEKESEMEPEQEVELKMMFGE